ncbi:ABC-type branched-subunit amino acid transport system substrate-binding protein [Actinocorallia herbida]|uniref:ABC-type branched-subunit amino acid transport system substrate-binding protein n=1 Tax=Actinocorallia herbida TaxID=58109 RepID=A0A3N1D3C2_9ACTN|nr:ABC-type branched-subunit amino acid transport system substrate-binding protein [Actinocorallia herbida]
MAVAAAALLALALTAACGADAGTADGTADTPAAPFDFGAPNAATGAPIKIGYVNEGQSAALDTTNEERSAKAVSDYANAYLGGLAGHRIELVPCQIKGTPSGAQACGSKFVRDGVVAVVGSSPGQPSPVIQQLGTAGIPFAANLLAEQQALRAENVFIFGNPLSVFGTPAQHAKQQGYKRAAIVVIDVPGSAAPAKQIAPMIFGNAGVQLDVVLVPPGTADMTPQVQTARTKNPQQWFVLGDPTFCSTAAKAFQTLAVPDALLFDSRCLGQNAASALPGIEKLKFVSTYSTDPADADYALMQGIFAEYGGVETDGSSLTAFQAMLSLVRAVNAAEPTEVTPASVAAALKSAPAVDYPLGHGIKIRCDSPLAAISPNICSTGGLLADADADASLKNFQAIDAGPLYAAPAAPAED